MQVGHTAVERRELLVVLLGDLHAVALAQLHHDVEEVHRVERDLVAQPQLGLEAGELLVRRDGADDVLDGFDDLFAGHGFA
jgi:hypothetical protein